MPYGCQKHYNNEKLIVAYNRQGGDAILKTTQSTKL